jgi:multisubunit Na+/H+ antiporter MnhF subunit
MTPADLGLALLAVALCAAIGAGLWRLRAGPTSLDRMLGFDMVTITVVALIVVFSAATRSIDEVELILVLSGLGFLTTVAYFYYLMQLRPDDDELDVKEEP